MTFLKRTFLILSLSFFFNMHGQGITFDLISKKTMTVKNNYNCSMRVIVKNDYSTIFDKVLLPEESSNISYRYHKNVIESITYEEYYDDTAFNKDRIRVERIRKIENQKRRDQLLTRLIITVVDEAFFDGSYSKLIEITKYGDMLFNGATEEEWSRALFNTAVGFSIDEFIDEKSQRILAKTAFELLNTMSNENPKLQNYWAGLMKLRTSGYSKNGFVQAKPPMKFFNFSISFSYPVNQRFMEENTQREIESITINSESFKNEFPFEVRLNYNISPKTRFFFEFARTNVFVNTNNLNFQFSEINNAFKFSTYSIGIAPTFSIFEIGLGATYLQQENFLIQETINDFQPLNSTKGWGFTIEPKINIKIGNRLSLFGSWKGVYFGVKKIEKTSLLLSNFKIGINFNIIRGGLNFKS